MLKNILLITLLAFGGTAYAESIQVMGKAHYKGQNNVVRLKQLAKQKLSALGEEASQFELVGVSMKAKSRRGKGAATLIVGQDQESKTVGHVGGDQALFSITAPWTYMQMHWDISDMPGLADERWQMRFRGNIKVRSIELHLSSGLKRVRIPMGGDLFTQDSAIFLKRELKDLGYNLKNKKLRKVVLVAKSKRGHGQAELQIGQKMKPMKNIDSAQGGFGFQSDRPRSYNRIKWRAQGQTKGAWRIHMRGRIKVKAVIVEFQ